MLNGKNVLSLLVLNAHAFYSDYFFASKFPKFFENFQIECAPKKLIYFTKNGQYINYFVLKCFNSAYIVLTKHFKALKVEKLMFFLKI